MNNEDMLFATEDQMAELLASQPEEVVDAHQYLIFVSDGLKFGIDADCVVEIITDFAISFLPRLPEYIRGIINLRGNMVPIVDIRLMVGKEPLDDYLVIVLDINGTQIGILVDDVDQMISIPNKDILPMPANTTQKLVSGMCTLRDGSGTMMVLDTERLLEHRY